MRTHQVLVNIPLQTAFEYVSDLTRHPEWSGGELKIRPLTPGPVAVGKEYMSHGEVAIQKDRANTVRISHYEPPHRFGFVAMDPSFGKVVHQFLLEEQPGGVRITRTMTISVNPVLAAAFRFLIYPLVGSPSMNKSMAALKQKLEANP